MKTVETIVDKKIYTRVRSTKETVDNMLAEKLGVALSKVTFEYEDIGGSTCCPQMKVIAYAEITNKKRTKDIMDD